MIERCALQYLIEVKSGVNSKLRSLHQYMDRTPHDIAIRVWTERFSIDNVTTPNGKAFRLVNIPFYYIGEIDKIISMMSWETSSDNSQQTLYIRWMSSHTSVWLYGRRWGFCNSRIEYPQLHNHVVHQYHLEHLSINAILKSNRQHKSKRLSNKFRQSLFLYNYVMLPKTVWR